MSGWYFMNRCIACLALPLVLMAGCVTSGEGAKAEKGKNEDLRVGGACSYKSYEGTLHITRIVRTEASRKQAGVMGGPGYEGYEIHFRFLPEEGIALEGWPAAALDREHMLTLYNGWYPGPRFIEKYQLAEGKEYPCTVEIIQKGTCTPLIFGFPTINITDYFETRR